MSHNREVFCQNSTQVMLENAGRDATSAVLDETAHSKRALQMMKHYCIGMLNDNECHDEGNSFTKFLINHTEFKSIFLVHGYSVNGHSL